MRDPKSAGASPLPVTNIPPALRELPQWVGWKYIERDGKPTKCPVNAKTGGTADSTDPATWATFEQALVAYESDSLAGVGFVFTDDAGLCGVDLDDSVDPTTGKLKPWAQEIVQRLDSYTETSPSGHGVKIFLRARKPGTRCRKAHGDGEVEIYDSGRFFTVTARRLDGFSADVEQRQAQLEELYAAVLGESRPVPPVHVQPPAASAPTLGDDEIIQKASSSKTGQKFAALWAGRWNDHFKSWSEGDSSLACMLAFYTKDPAQIDRMFRTSGLMRPKWDEKRGAKTYGQMTIAKALATVTEQYVPRSRRPARGQAPAHAAEPSSIRDLPIVIVAEDEHRVVSESIVALSADEGLYQRDGILVRTRRDADLSDHVSRPSGSITIQALPAANLRERLTRYMLFAKLNREGQAQACHPPQWLVDALDARGEWPGIRPLLGVSEAPVLRPDGSVWQTPGYDAATGVLYESAKTFPAIADDPKAADAAEARDALLEVVCDFPFEAPEHQAAWLAALLTPVGRFAFAGPSPLFLIDANVRGAGKGLLAQTISRIVLGREMPASSYAHDPEEMRKRITAIAIAGDRMVLLDNLAGAFGNSAIDAALTCTRWKDRILGKSKEVDLPLLSVWYATGNNVAVAADTARRIIHVRIDVMAEKPEERTGFRHPNLFAWIGQNRPRLLSAVLTILSAYCRAGRPDFSLTPFGSFEGWSGLVRQAVVWVGLPDPCLTRVQLTEASDVTTGALRQLLRALYDYLGSDSTTAADLLKQLYTAGGDPLYEAPRAADLRSAIENIVNSPAGRPPEARKFGNALRRFRRRVVDGLFLDVDTEAGRRAGAVWRVCGTPRPGERESCESGESFSTPFAREVEK